MTEKEFCKALLKTEELNELLTAMKDGLEGVYIEDSDGDRIGPDLKLTHFLFQANTEEVPELEFTVDLDGFHMRIDEHTWHMPPDALCSISQAIEETHARFHENLMLILAHLMSKHLEPEDIEEAEKDLTERLILKFLHKN